MTSLLSGRYNVCSIQVQYSRDYWRQVWNSFMNQIKLNQLQPRFSLRLPQPEETVLVERYCRLVVRLLRRRSRRFSFIPLETRWLFARYPRFYPLQQRVHLILVYVTDTRYVRVHLVRLQIVWPCGIPFLERYWLANFTGLLEIVLGTDRRVERRATNRKGNTEQPRRISNARFADTRCTVCSAGSQANRCSSV